MKNLLILGLGYVASHWLETLNLKKWKVTATTSNERTIDRWEASDITLLHHDDPKVIDVIENAQAILVSAPPNKDGDDPFFLRVKNHVNVDKIKWLAYLSSTSVYGDCQGDWVTESDPLRAETSMATRRIKAEAQWQTLVDLCPLHVFRLSGIYGPLRNAVHRISEGKKTTIYKEGHIFNRIHVDDIVQVLSASLKNPTPGEIYNVSDNLPCGACEVDDYAASLLGLSPLKRVDWQEAGLTDALRQFYVSSRRVSNKKVNQKLGVDFIYPTYKEGLKSIFDLENS